MALADLMSKIQADAQAEAAQLEADAAAEAQRVATAAADQADQIAEDAAKQADIKAAAMLDKVQNLARQEYKAGVLQMQRELLAIVAEQAADQIKQLSNGDKQNILLGLLQQIDTDNPTIHPVVGDEAAVKTALQAAKKDFTIGESITGLGGFMVVGELVEIDCRFDTLLQREVLTQEELALSALLFDR